MDRSISRAVRGVVAGLAVCATMRVAFVLADIGVRHTDASPDTDPRALLGGLALYAVGIGVPAGVAVGWLVAWAVRLRRPWMVALFGPLLALVLLCLYAQVAFDRSGESLGYTWLVAVLLAVTAYAAVAVVSPLFQHVEEP